MHETCMEVKTPRGKGTAACVHDMCMFSGIRRKKTCMTHAYSGKYPLQRRTAASRTQEHSGTLACPVGAHESDENDCSDDKPDAPDAAIVVGRRQRRRKGSTQSGQDMPAVSRASGGKKRRSGATHTSQCVFKREGSGVL